MLSRNAQYLNPGISPVTKTGHLSLLTDLSRDPVFLKGRIKNGPTFAAAMLILGKIVKTSARQGQKDHSAYQEWVQGKYLEEIEDVRAERLAQLPALKSRHAELRALIKEVEAEIQEASDKLNDQKAIRRYWDWLYDHNREAWIVIDPIVSVQPDATFFEGFSLDESIYVRVKLPNECVEAEEPIQLGTTNIDFGLGLEKEFARVRSYRPLDIEVGLSSVQIETEIGSAVEKKIELPESWVRGLLEVQSASTIASTHLEVSPVFMAEIIARLEEEKEKNGPRSLRFKLVPGKPITVELEPWGTELSDPKSNYDGSEPSEIRVWGRRRLLLLKDILPDAEAVKIGLIGSGMPSFWTVNVNETELQVGLSGWTSLDWASRARFAAFLPKGDLSESQLTRISALLKSHGMISARELSAEANFPLKTVSIGLMTLCGAGKALFDSELGVYRWRELYPEFNPSLIMEASLEERKGIELIEENAVNIENLEELENGIRISAIVHDKNAEQVEAELDLDGRVIYAECSCYHFKFHKLREGPCRHMVAVISHEGSDTE